MGRLSRIMFVDWFDFVNDESSVVRPVVYINISVTSSKRDRIINLRFAWAKVGPVANHGRVKSIVLDKDREVLRF